MNQVYEKDGYILRLARKEDAEEYYENNFQPFDPETARLTGSRTDFTHDEVVGFLKKCIDDKDPVRLFDLLSSGEDHWGKRVE